MRVPRSIKTVLPLVALSLLGLPATAHKAPPNLDAVVVDATFLSDQASYPSIDFGRSGSARDDREGTSEWTTFFDTGNCCENYLTSSKDGRLMDFGGSYVNFTDDDGKTWKSVRPITPLQNGEGAIAVAPGGDVVGVEWDPYTGDHLLAFKYDVEDKKWIYAEMPVHAPFYDREWIASVPGPFTIDGQKVPYVSFIKGAWPSKEAWFYSTDGINYDRVMSKFLDQTVAGGQGGRTWVPTSGTPDSDWLQPNTNGGIFPTGGGWAIASPDVPFSGGDWAVLNPKTLTWETFAPRGGARGRYQVDSAGTLHNVISEDNHFLYRVSTDGHRTWKTLKVPLPKGHVIEEIDFRANRAVGIAAVAIHGHERKSQKDKDMLFTLDITKSTPRLANYYQVGLGDVNGASGVGAEIRFDFETVTILPDGRVAMSFYDTTTELGGRVQPAMAIQTEK
ncbi:MAG TPA: hypothetical protein VJ927_00725 [Actinomycetota bacterium]|nr:hypothetical protein [Actinomycetota bacterium]